MTDQLATSEYTSPNARSTAIVAGTSRGVFLVTEAGAEPVLESGGVRDLFQLDGRIFAGTGDGLRTSDDGGRSWSGTQLAGREVWQVRSGGSGRLFAGTQPAGLFRSDDHGDSWTEIESFAQVPEAQAWCVPLDPPLEGRARAIVVDATNDDRIWVGVEVGGIARTTDGGETWSVALPYDNPDLHMLYAQPGEPEVIYASTGYGRFDHIAEELEGNAGVLRSDNGGETWNYAWTGVTPRYSRPMCIDPRPPHALTVGSAPTAFSNYKEEGGANAALFQSLDRGESWRSLADAAHTPSAANIHGLTVDPSVVGGALVGTDTGEVWRVSPTAEWELLAADLPAVLSLLTIDQPQV